MKKPSFKYTLRDVPVQVDRRLREAAVEYGLSLNQTVLKILNRGLGLDKKPVKRRDLSGLASSLSDAEAKVLEEMAVAQRQVNPKDWA